MSKTVFTLKLKSESEVERSVRRTWGFSPVSRTFKCKKDYSRANNKRIERASRLED